MKPFGFALMMLCRNARSTHVTVHKIIIALHTTNAAFIAVIIISLNSVIKKVAHGAKIGGELNATFTVAACLGHGLFFIALIAYHFCHIVPVHFMCLCFIVAVTAHILFAATRRD